MPCGRTEAGILVGLHLIGRYRDERGVLAAAATAEAALQLDMRPPAPWGLTSGDAHGLPGGARRRACRL
jgi:hypothetical protein